MDVDLPEVVLTVVASVDGRITLGRHQRLLDPSVGRRWASIERTGVFGGRGEEIGASVVLEGSGSFVDVDAEAPPWLPATTADSELWRDHLPRATLKWFVVADGRGRVDWTYTGDAETALHVLVCRATPSGYLQRLRDLGVGYFVAGDRHVDLRGALARMRTVFRADRVIIDSGGTMNASLLLASPGDVSRTGLPAAWRGLA